MTNYTEKYMKFWTTEEKLIRTELAKIRKYPRWENWEGGSILWLHRDLWVEEVFKHRDGRWQVYSQVSPDKCYFKSLREALDCAERLAGEYLRRNGLKASRVGSISGRKPFCRDEGGLPSISNNR
jgi:hypothetical protein